MQASRRQSNACGCRADKFLTFLGMRMHGFVMYKTELFMAKLSVTENIIYTCMLFKWLATISVKD